MDSNAIKLGTRGSDLALWQANHVKDILEKFQDRPVELVIISTKGDEILDVPLKDIGSKGLFTFELEQAMIEGRIDAAVHSLKDLPTQMTEGLCVNAVVKRNDPRDAFLSYSSKSFKDLKPQSKIGTSSFRRHAQLNLLRNDLQIVSMREPARSSFG